MKPNFYQIRYSELCSELGHLVSNIDKMQERIAQIKHEIKFIDDYVERIKAMERLTGAPLPNNVMPFKKDTKKDEKPDNN